MLLDGAAINCQDHFIACVSVWGRCGWRRGGGGWQLLQCDMRKENEIEKIVMMKMSSSSVSKIQILILTFITATDK